jgi:hypothetical protein
MDEHNGRPRGRATGRSGQPALGHGESAFGWGSRVRLFWREVDAGEYEKREDGGETATSSGLGDSQISHHDS